jgi:hypothetical protein
MVQKFNKKSSGESVDEFGAHLFDFSIGHVLGGGDGVGKTNCFPGSPAN